MQSDELELTTKDKIGIVLMYGIIFTVVATIVYKIII